MTDYSKWKVTDLKAELKRRGIAQTGLRVKQQFIDKILEIEAGDQAGGSTEGASAGPETTDAQGTAEQQPAKAEQPAEQPTPDAPQDVKPEEQKTEEPKPEQAQKSLAQNGDVEKRDEPKPAEPTAATPRDEAEVDQPMTDAAEQERQEEKSQEEEQADTGKEAEKTTEEMPALQAQPDEVPAQPVEQAPGDAMAQEALSEQREPTVTEPAASTDKDEPSAKVPEAGNELPPALPAEEVAEDRLKRKRRSQSPIATPEALASKKAKAQDEKPRVVLPEDREGLATEEQLVKEQVQQEGAREEHGASAPAPEEWRPRKEAPHKQDARFKGLFAGADRGQVRPASPPADMEMKDAEVEPALHVATAALYIGGLMRPLQPGMLRKHLITLASAPGSSPSEDVIVDFHLDHIKTHCFVSFANISAASRVRSALHGNIWPNERNRKNLFVDFIPEQKLQQWIDMEEESRRRGGPQPRWEVRYNRIEDGVEAVLEEIDPKSAAGNLPPRSRQESMTDSLRIPPSGPRADRERFPGSSRAPPPTEPRPSPPGQGFKPLDELFKSTTVKPKLYYLPVSRKTADRRLDRFDDLLRKGDYPRRGGDETRRISFEDGDLFVDNGPEFAGGGRNRRRRGRGRGGGFGDSWRG